MPKPHKVFCVGFQKTGTTSMEAALEILGYRTASIYGRDWPLARLQAEYVSHGLDLATRYDAVQDMPWPLIYRELDAAFPGSKFILTWRDTDRWLASITGHFGANPAVLQQLTYGADAAFPVGHEARYREVYERHNAARSAAISPTGPGISSTSTSAAAAAGSRSALSSASRCRPSPSRARTAPWAARASPTGSAAA